MGRGTGYRQRAGSRRSLAPAWRATAGLVIALLVALVAAEPWERFPEYMPRLTELTAQRSVAGRVTRVRDGDTIVVEGVPIRFGSLDCAEMDSAQGRRARTAMLQLVANRDLSCHLTGRKSYDRWIGSCRLDDGRDLAAEMIRNGHCTRYW